MPAGWRCRPRDADSSLYGETGAESRDDAAASLWKVTASWRVSGEKARRRVVFIWDPSFF